jgi:hypothetical protein
MVGILKEFFAEGKTKFAYFAGDKDPFTFFFISQINNILYANLY